MSDYESHSGKVRLLYLNPGETFEEQCLRLWLASGKEEKDYSKGELFSEFGEDYLKVGEQIWEILEHEDLGDEDMFCRLQDNGDGSFSFYTRFYNGGTCLTEMIEDEIKKLDDEEA